MKMTQLMATKPRPAHVTGTPEHRHEDRSNTIERGVDHATNKIFYERFLSDQRGNT